MHHPVQYQVTAHNIQEDRLRAAQASRLAKQTGSSSPRFLGLPFKFLGIVKGLLAIPFKAFRNQVQEVSDAQQYDREIAGRVS
jgi:hypothetical protein